MFNQPRISLSILHKNKLICNVNRGIDDGFSGSGNEQERKRVRELVSSFGWQR